MAMIVKQGRIIGKTLCMNTDIKECHTSGAEYLTPELSLFTAYPNNGFINRSNIMQLCGMYSYIGRVEGGAAQLTIMPRSQGAGQTKYIVPNSNQTWQALEPIGLKKSEEEDAYYKARAQAANRIEKASQKEKKKTATSE